MDGVEAYDAGPLAFFAWSKTVNSTERERVQEINRAYERGAFDARRAGAAAAEIAEREAYEDGWENAVTAGRLWVLIALVVGVVGGHFVW